MSNLLLALFVSTLAGAIEGASLDRVLLWSGESHTGVLLVSSDEEVIFELVEPDGQTSFRRMPRADVAAIEPVDEPTTDWVARWQAVQTNVVATGDQQDAWRTPRLAAALEDVRGQRWRQAIRELREIVDDRSDSDRAAVSRLLELQTGKPLEVLAADLQIRAAAEGKGSRVFQLVYRPRFEAEALGERLEMLYERLINTPVPEDGDAERLESFLDLPAQPEQTNDNPDPLTPESASKHTIAAWLYSPADYDGKPKAAQLMRGRVMFALNVLRERLVLAGTCLRDEAARKRVLAERKRLFELAAAAQSRAEGNPTPSEREAMRRAALQEMQRQAYEEERERQRAMFPGDDEECGRRRGGRTR